jgi:hypothetical protein
MMLPLHFWERQVELVVATAKSVRLALQRMDERKRLKDKGLKGQLPDEKSTVPDYDNWWPHEDL